MKPTVFPAPAAGVSERMAGFVAHLRANEFNVGVRETANVLCAMQYIDVHDSQALRLACQSILATCSEHFQRFDELFDAYWYNTGRQKNTFAQSRQAQTPNRNVFSPGVDTSERTAASGDAEQAESPDADPDSGTGQHTSGEGKLIGSRVTNLEKVDLREFMTPEAMNEAEAMARRLASAISDRRSRRRVAANRGSLLDLRKIMRHCISHGGEPVKLYKRQRPQRPVRIVALLDVSGSMVVYARVFLAFLKGLVSHDSRTDAYLFHTSLVRISDALRDSDTFRSVNALSLKAQGFGGGTRIGHNIDQFNRHYASNTVNGRSVVIILSDGYDTEPPERLANALARLRKRGCKLVWLNPLKGWKDYEPVAQAMAAALPYLHVFEPANTLESLAALEPHLERL